MRSGRCAATFSIWTPSVLVSTVGALALPSSSVAHGKIAPGCLPYHSVVATGTTPEREQRVLLAQADDDHPLGLLLDRGRAVLVLDRDGEARPRRSGTAAAGAEPDSGLVVGAAGGEEKAAQERGEDRRRAHELGHPNNLRVKVARAKWRPRRFLLRARKAAASRVAPDWPSRSACWRSRRCSASPSARVRSRSRDVVDALLHPVPRRTRRSSATCACRARCSGSRSARRSASRAR